MPLSTNLSAAPYFDDFDQSKDYYRILFKPATAVQVREVNQLQTILQDQVEQFGDHILKAGTIIDGCDFKFFNSMPYVKILDTTVSGAAVDLNEINGYFLKGTNGKEARIQHIEPGFESDGINLKTLYLNYTDDEDLTLEFDTFQAGEILQVIAKDNRVWSFNVDGGGNVQGFSNSDAIAVVSAIEVSTETDSLDFANTFFEGERLSNEAGTVQVLLTDDADFATQTEDGTYILRIKPDPAFQYGGYINTNTWQDLVAGMTLTSNTSVNAMKVVRKIGIDASATVVTTATGQIAEIALSTGGQGYEVPPHVSIYSAGATSQSKVSNLIITPQMFYNRVMVADATNYEDPVGVGYGMSIGAGKIYQKGLFLNVQSQFKMISKYSNTPDALSVGFDSIETVVNVFTDSTLYDNAAGFLNQSAPGADRLKLTPQLIVKEESEEINSSNFFPIVRFADGRPYQQNKETQYSKIGDMLAQRTFEESGNYALDPFDATTRSMETFADTASEFQYVVDPGHAYIRGYRITTETNFAKDVSKGLETFSETNQGFDVQYGSFFRVNEVGGFHSFKNNQLIELRPNPVDFVSTYDGSDITTSTGGSCMGTARIRMISHESGIQGTADAVYKIYVYDVQMNPGKRLEDARSIYSQQDNGAPDGIADIVLTPGNGELLRNVSRTMYSGGAVFPIPQAFAELHQPNDLSLVYDLGVPAKELTNFTYRYRSSVDGVYANTSGALSINAEGGANTSFPYFQNLSDVEEHDIILIPADHIDASSATYTGVTVNPRTTSGNSVTVTITASTPSTAVTPITDVFKVGDWLVDQSGNRACVTSIASGTTFTVTGDTGFNPTTITRTFPKDIPIQLASRTEMYANVSSDQQTMTIELGLPISNTNSFTVIYDQEVENERSALSVTRSAFVKLSTSGTFPKCLGIPGIFRLKAVYNGTDTSAADITTSFYVDHNQNESFYGLGYLYKREFSTVSLASTILVEVDAIIETTHGLKIVNSYSIQDNVKLEEFTGANTGINTLEIPEFNATTGRYYDLRECVDFRPMVANTADYATSASLATIDPSDVVTFPTGQIRVPKPQSDFTYDVTFYKARRDQISIKHDGSFDISVGGFELQPKENADKLPLYDCVVAPYPSLPAVFSPDMKVMAETGVYNVTALGQRIEKYSNQVLRIKEITQAYTMDEIANLERRIEALEYNQNLSALENAALNKTIQSGVDSTLERFKFGFFADNFENYDFSDVDNAAYAATIYEYVLQPASGQINIEFEIAQKSKKYKDGGKVVFPYARKRLLEQNIATYGPKPPEPVLPKIEMECTFESNRNMRSVGDRVARYIIRDEVWEEFTFIAADDTDGTSRNVEIRFFNPSGNISYEVIQSKTPPTTRRAEAGNIVWSPTRAPVPITQPTDAIELYNRLYPVKSKSNQIYNYATNPWFTPGVIGNDLDVYPDPTDATKTSYKTMTGSGKITFAYNHLNGKYLTVRVHKGDPVFNFEICYPATKVFDEIYDQGSGSYDTTPPPCPRGTVLYRRCRGNDLYTYACNGTGGQMVGNISRNHPNCVIIDDPPPPPEFKCPPSGTFQDDNCDGYTYRVYEYTGRFKNGTIAGGTQVVNESYANLSNCAVRVRLTQVNSTECGYVPDDDTPDCDTPGGYGVVPNPGGTDDDGCIPNVDPHCPIEGGSGDNDTTPSYTPGGYGTNNPSNPSRTPPVTPTSGGYGGSSPSRTSPPSRTTPTNPVVGGYGIRWPYYTPNTTVPSRRSPPTPPTRRTPQRPSRGGRVYPYFRFNHR